MALTDTLDELISDRRIEPQLALKVLTHYDRAVSDVLGEKVKARMSFKVSWRADLAVGHWFSRAESACTCSGASLHISLL